MCVYVCVCFKKAENAYEHARVCYFSVQSQTDTKAFLRVPGGAILASGLRL